MLTDEQVLNAFFLNKCNYTRAARQLGVTKELIHRRIFRLVFNGVNVPHGTRKSHKYPPERVAELNEYIRTWTA